MREASEKAVEAGSRTLGSDHPLVLAAAFERTRALVGLRQPEAVRELVTRVYEARVGRLGEGHPDTVETRRLVDSPRREADPSPEGIAAPAGGS